MINMFWEECNGPSFFKHIYRPENFLYLNCKNVIHPHKKQQEEIVPDEDISFILPKISTISDEWIFEKEQEKK